MRLDHIVSSNSDKFFCNLVKLIPLMRKCLACKLNRNPYLVPGGRIAATKNWIVEHCLGPFGVGAVVIKTKRHVENFSECSDKEMEEFARLIKSTHLALEEVLKAEQIYVSKWGEETPHIHFLIQPVQQETKEQFKAHGPLLQAKMVQSGEEPNSRKVSQVAKN